MCVSSRIYIHVYNHHLRVYSRWCDTIYKPIKIAKPPITAILIGSEMLLHQREYYTFIGWVWGQHVFCWTRGPNCLVLGSNITHVDREPVDACFVLYLLFSCDVSGQHCVAGPTSIIFGPVNIALRENIWIIGLLIIYNYIETK